MSHQRSETAVCGSHQVTQSSHSKLHTMPINDVSSKAVGIVKRLCEDGCLQDALLVARRLEQPASSDIFYELINWSIRYKELTAGRSIQSLIIESGLEADHFLANNLIRMFGLCGSLPEVNQVFSKLCKPDDLTWSVTIAAFANLGRIDTAIFLCNFVKLFDRNATEYMLTTMLKACSNACALRQGKMVHDFAVRAGLESMTVVVNSLIHMYFKCGTDGDARKVFDKVTGRDVVTWTATLAGYVQLKDGAEALQIFERMGSSGIEPNRVTYTGVLRACAYMGSPLEGRLIHAEIIEQGLDQTTVVGNSLIDMYTKCNSLQDGLRVFDCLTNKNIVSWTAILEGYIQDARDGTKVMTVFEQMLKGGWKPDNVLFLHLLKACNKVLLSVVVMRRPSSSSGCCKMMDCTQILAWRRNEDWKCSSGFLYQDCEFDGCAESARCIR
ncbi:hypothetical protein GOP47_0026661 [Adiantum capillus-veneris]|nr:hypothetical protein GOP47_0026661 [Adiantum capillus-veneris]